MHHAQRLICRLLKHSHDRLTGRIANRLLEEFWRGSSLESLRELLHHHDEDVLKAAMFILSELAQHGRPLIDELPRLLHHPLPYVRWHAIDAVHTATVGVSVAGYLIADAVSLIDDVDDNVRDRALQFMLAADEGQLRAAFTHLKGSTPESPHAAGLRWLLDADGQDPVQTIARLQTVDRVTRAYSITAARRMAPESRVALDHALASSDAEVRRSGELAARAVKVLTLVRKHRERMQ